MSASTPSGEHKKAELRKTKLTALIVSIATAAAPGVYSAYQSAKTAYQQRVEEKTRDKQESSLTKNVKSLQADVDAVEKSCVTHKDLVDLVLKLRDSQPGRVRVSRRPRPPSPREQALLSKIASLKAKADVAKQAQDKAKVIRKAAPKLRPVKYIRQQVQQQLKKAQ